MQIRHNLVVPEKPFFRRGRCVPKAAHHVWAEAKTSGFSAMRRSRIGLGVLTGMAVCAAARALALWPHARDAGAILAAQDDPAELADVRLNSALRNSPALIAENIEAALAAGDADLASSFVELARDKNIAARRRTVAAGRASRRGRKFDRRILPSALPPASSPATPTMSRACRARSPAISSCSAISGTSCAKASIWRWARIPTIWCSGLPPPASR